MSYSYDRYERTARGPQQSSSRRGTFSYWLPLAFTVTVAAVGIVAWIWSERNDDEDELPPPPGGYGDNVYPRPPDRPLYGRNPDGSVMTGPPSYGGGDVRPGEVAYGTVPAQTQQQESQSYMARMSGALKRTPSPQQVFDGASRTVVSGIAAAGAVVGSALSSIKEEDKHAYTDHKTWSEEAESRQPGASPGVAPPGGIEMRSGSVPGVSATQRVPVSNGKRKTVAIVVSADTGMADFDEDEFHEHASILSHLPKNIDFAKIRLFVLIYAPGLQEHPLDTAATARPPGSLGSSFETIRYDQAQSPGDESQKILTSHSASPAFNAVYSEALSLVEKETMVLPFTTPTGHVHILRHLNPEIVYLQESLAGDNGDVITHLQTWLRQDVVVVVGADGGHGGLADSESEAEAAPKKEQWWEREDRVGRGRGVVVVEGVRVGDDWKRRVDDRE